MARRRPAARRGERRRESVLKAATRSVQKRRARRRAWLLAGLILGIPAVLAGAVWGGTAAWRALFSENDYFRIRNIEVTTDGTLGRGHIVEYAKVQEGDNLFAVSPREAREWLLKVPVIANAQVGRRLPDTLLIEVTERMAVARLGRTGGGCPLAVDAEGHVLGPSSVRASLPVVLGLRDKGLRPGDRVRDDALGPALEVLTICNHREMRRELDVATVDVAPEDGLELGLATGERILLTRDKLAEKLERLWWMRREARRRGLDLRVYDMTSDNNYVGRPAAWREPGTVP